MRKMKTLENELDMSKTQLKKFYSVQLGKLLNSHRPNNEKGDLEFTVMGFSIPFSSRSPPVTEGKTVFVSSSKDKGKNTVVCDVVSKPKFGPLPRREPTSKFVHTCHHCGRVGHIRPNYFQLRQRNM